MLIRNLAVEGVGRYFVAPVLAPASSSALMIERDGSPAISVERDHAKEPAR